MAVVAFCASGTKRMLSLALSNSALLSATVPTSSQPAPKLYCHLPLPLLTPVIAIPCNAAASTSLTPVLLPVAAEPASRSEISWPMLPVASSLIGVSTGSPVASTGASLTAVTLMPSVPVPTDHA